MERSRGADGGADPYGRLAAAVREAKGGDPLRSVTVVTSSFAVSRDALRYLARHGGVANTSVLTTSQLVEQLARPRMFPRAALPFPILVGSVRRVLTERPGRFEEVADQPITARAVANASRWLGSHPPRTAEGSAPVVTEVLRIHDDASARHAAGYFRPHEQFEAARARLDTLGSTIVFLPCELDPATADFLDEVRARSVTVDQDPADAGSGTMVLHASDADDEVRSVVRLARDRIATGVPGHRIGVFYGSESPYLEALHRHFAAAGITVNGPDARGLADGAAARSLLRLLRMDPDAIARRELLAILAERAVRWTSVDGVRLSARQAEILTRTHIAVVGGPDWARLRTVEPDDHRHETAVLLLDLVESLRADLTTVAAARTWGAASAAVADLIVKYFVAEGRAAPDHAALLFVAQDLENLVGVGPEPSIGTVLEAVEIGVEAGARRVGEPGVGVTIGPIAEGSGRDLDISVVVGMAEGIVPAVRREDPLLPDSVTGVSQADLLELQRRSLAFAIGAGRRERILTFPRGSLRGGAEKVPSRWLLGTLERLADRKVSESRWREDTENSEGIVVVESFDAGMHNPKRGVGAEPATEAEWLVRAGAAARGECPIIAGATELRADRRFGRFTRFTGNVASAAELITLLSQPIAPTRLEEWVASPYLFFIQRVLGVSPLDDPDEDTRIDPLSRGNLVHKILEDYVAEVIDGAPGSLERLLEIADQQLAAAAEDAPGWLPQVWEHDARIIRAGVAGWHAHDAVERGQGWSPIGVEAAFGADGEAAVSLGLDLGSMGFLGKVDRIDRHTDGRVRVTDYKTGITKDFKGLIESQPTAQTTKFQLPVYGLFGQTLADGSQVLARYWFVTEKGGFDSVGYPITDLVIDTLRRDLSFCQKSIGSGAFPPRSGSYSVAALAELLGKSELENTWRALRAEPALRELVAIHEGDGL
ncbi:PD-(D/E)XK nuclease family protein [Tomitella biformata]|uniref:PD-(D/E)XK nuclease family protein n=1 Tax=Tomitella biformata TaxID=630403 RepID=UPI0004650622|nr:PD-(D/E)XK nuclease family protein [Tomitella biformata]